jgi:hypothetical protein
VTYKGLTIKSWSYDGIESPEGDLFGENGQGEWRRSQFRNVLFLGGLLFKYFTFEAFPLQLAHPHKRDRFKI